jgi:hypothetical protein
MGIKLSRIHQIIWLFKDLDEAIHITNISVTADGSIHCILIHKRLLYVRKKNTLPNNRIRILIRFYYLSNLITKFKYYPMIYDGINMFWYPQWLRNKMG